MKNMAAIKPSHKLQVLKPSVNTYGCYYRNRNSCPLDRSVKHQKLYIKGIFK